MNKKINSGFTLMEVLVVISIIGLLSGVILPSTNSARVKAKDAMRVSQIDEVQKALELYNSTYGHYPDNTVALTDTKVPQNWANMLDTLNTEGFIKATIAENDILDTIKIFLANLIFFKTAYAVIAPPPPAYYYASIQDPLYKVANDYLYSYGYVAYNGGKTYKIRLHLENSSNQIFNSSQQGVFLDNSVVGATACDSSLNYYCTCL
ncbi:MAG: prepilin-type N-terminal cleavage/methylation domain-containing protein, partial [Nitrospira sp.]